MRTYALSLAVGLCCVSPAAAQDLTKLDLTKTDRSIAKQPEYAGSPRYGLLVFGRQAKTPVWFVLDGKTVYLDRNGNGDLTEPGERFDMGNRSGITLGDITEADGTTTHTGLYVYLYDDFRFRLRVNIANRARQMVGWGKSSYPKPRLAKRPEDAPLIHLNGPLTIGRYGPMSIVPRKTDGQSYRLTWLRLLVGSRGVGHGTFAGYTCGMLRCDGKYRKPMAEIEFPNRESAGQPLRVTQALEVKG